MQIPPRPDMPHGTAANSREEKTANGEVFDTYKYTAAHKTLPFDTVLKVENLENGRSVAVRINDRGPFVGKQDN